ncbi:MAG: hypothetical protein WAT51_04000 [Holophaga sp.]
MRKARNVFIGAAIAILGLVALSVLGAAFEWAFVETDRFAEPQADGSILFAVNGFVACPLTVDGPFPRWNNNMTAIFNRGVVFSPRQDATYHLSKDFTAQYGMLTSGEMTISPEKNEINLVVSYAGEYQWNRVRGKFPIRTKKQQ